MQFCFRCGIDSLVTLFILLYLLLSGLSSGTKGVYHNFTAIASLYHDDITNPFHYDILRFYIIKATHYENVLRAYTHTTLISVANVWQFVVVYVATYVSMHCNNAVISTSSILSSVLAITLHNNVADYITSK